jgi:hypothetical protein
MTNHISQEITPIFMQVARDLGFQEVSRVYTPQDFGNAVIVLATPDFKLRVIRDRSQIFIDVRPNTGIEWHDLQYVLEFVDAEIIKRAHVRLNEAELAAGLRDNYPTVAILMRTDLNKYGFLGYEQRKFAQVKKEIL